MSTRIEQRIECPHCKNSVYIPKYISRKEANQALIDEVDYLQYMLNSKPQRKGKKQ